MQFLLSACKIYSFMAVDKLRGWCPGRDLNPHEPFGPTDFKSVASAGSATRAQAAAPILACRPTVSVQWRLLGEA